MINFSNEAWFQIVLLSHGSRLFVSVLAGLLVLFLSGCAAHEKTTQANASLHVVVEDTSSDLTTAFAPVFVLPGWQES